MEHYLVITAIGTDRPGITDEITRHISQSGCNIEDSRLAIFGSEFTFILLLSGTASAISRVEATLPLQAQQLDLLTMMKRTTRHEHRFYPYTAEFHIEGTDAPGLIEKFTHFCATRQIDISALSAHSQEDENHGEDDQLTLQLSTNLPEGCNLMSLQEEFEALCQDLDVLGTVTFTGHNPKEKIER
ncbi:MULTISPECIES: glycine cleavage system protein R [unclassified Photobacterium]|uniref:glycine cleavage system protein R n=1 Tax=unclassified Photobacterium TaxID=2628852 RepID=UPI001B8CFBF1|nr:MULTISPECIES: glycine cleavage system protein R [unclassified Photobacterium]MDO6708453.1 glycine cleavage system protein R [Photobacterium sp. 1_MG-2023]QUJ66840.1 glycine cleavage system protein R [Photobacterium sp. GJ3]